MANQKNEVLTPKQRMFVEYYIGISNGNATDAAKRCGYAAPGQEGHRLLKNAEIKTAISERYKEAAMSADEALARLGKIARSTLADAFETVGFVDLDAQGEPEMYDAETGDALPNRYVQRLSLEKLAENGVIHNVTEISYNEYGPKIKLMDAQSALDKIARAHGLYSENGNALEIVVKAYTGVDTDKI